MNPTQSTQSDSQCDVLLLFVNDNERQAVMNAAKALGVEPEIDSSHTFVYYDFGDINGVRVMGLQTRMGAGGRGASGAATLTAIQEMNPDFIIAVGVAFGINREKQKIGEILVSDQVAMYEPAKIAGRKTWFGFRKKGVIGRGDTATSSEGLFSKIQAAASQWDKAKVNFGLMVSGEKLIDHKRFKQDLLERYPEAIGGEMEAAGVYASAELKKKDWIIIKAVCDYADGHKDVTKQKNQEVAAKNAAEFVFHGFQCGVFKTLDQPNNIKINNEAQQTPNTDEAYSLETVQCGVYISCVKKDEKMGKRLHRDIKRLGLKPWLYSEDATPGLDKKLQIHQAFQNCRYFIPLISKFSVSQRGLVQSEMKMAFDILDEYPRSDIYFIPIRLDQTQLPDYRLEDITPADFTQSYEKGFKQLLRVFSLNRDAPQNVVLEKPSQGLPDKSQTDLAKPDEQSQALKPDSQKVEKVSQEIGAILEESSLKRFKNMLIETLKDNRPDYDQSTTSPEKALAEINVLDAIYILERTVNQCFEAMRKENATNAEIMEIWDRAASILGWLVLLAVNYDQLKTQKGQMQFKLEIPVLTEAGEEIIFSSYTDATPKLTTNPQRNRVFGENRIDSHLPESGPLDIVDTIKKDLWRKLFKLDTNEPPAIIDANQTKMLNRRIKRKNDKKENIYISAPSNDLDNPLNDKTVLRQLEQELPDLYTVIVTVEKDAASDTLFILAEPELEGELLEFFEHKPE